MPLSRAMIFPPPGGPALVSVVETEFVNATRQSITLATDARTRGENKIVITRFADSGGDGNFGEIADVDLLQVDLLGEARAAWPDAAMEVSPFYAQNAYGPFGYAVGRAPAGDVCLYGWQRIEPRQMGAGRTARGTVAIRLQVCDRAAGEQRLLNLMYQMRLRDPVFEPWRASPRIGAVGVPMVPQGAGGLAQVLEPAPAPRPAAQVRTVAANPEPAPVPTTPGVVAEPEPTGPIVPLPTGAAGPSGATRVVVPMPPGADN